MTARPKSGSDHVGVGVCGAGGPWRPASLGAVDVDAIGSGPAVAADGFMVFLSRPAG
jgi:hypothetical protein